MVWKDKAKEWGGGDVGFLSEDGEAIIFIVCGDPILMMGKFKGQETERIAAPIVTSEGFVLQIIGKRLFRRLAKYEDRFSDTAFMVVRRGASGDSKSKYELSVVDDPIQTKLLFDVLAEIDIPELLGEAEGVALDILKD